ncbi:hypothetical protein [Clostridium ljungdahlii]|uniref:DUF115 domain-containing protein n=1 Tax=Clostridium ljungdahlii (strain ATCC 55383 / DSM 13528 / PETC) TaxID=748727 RepID=D8GQB3_CLOLD|nr:hypothetical protein [Clostridium ljungdahlii]ADK14036.1 hypothetical protein CLJU_c09680 [Clostridium ljungdahlii DSM 13528]OAA87527.1 hypothetical protein WX45_03647 [Clostridium ljungdahlii DSM 13528]
MDFESKYLKSEEEKFTNNAKLLSKYQNIKIKNMDLNPLTHKVKKISDNYVIPFIYNQNMWKAICKEDGSDIDEFVDEIKLKYVNDVIIVFGFGIGYHIDALHKKYPNNNILVLESDFQIIKIAALYGNLENILSSDKVSIGLFKKEEDLDKILRHYFGNYNRVNFIASAFSNYSELYTYEFEQLVNSLNKLKIDIEKNRQERIKLSEDILNSTDLISIIKKLIDDSEALNQLNIKINMKNILKEINIKSNLIKEGISCLNNLYSFLIGDRNININKAVEKFNQIEVKTQLSPELSAIMDIAMYKYVDILNEDEEIKIRVTDSENITQIKKIMYNLKIYKYRNKCMSSITAELKRLIKQPQR